MRRHFRSCAGNGVKLAVTRSGRSGRGSWRRLRRGQKPLPRNVLSGFKQQQGAGVADWGHGNREGRPEGVRTLKGPCEDSGLVLGGTGSRRSAEQRGNMI